MLLISVNPTHIFVAEVDWCSTNIDQKSQSSEKNLSTFVGIQIQENRNKSDISQLLFFKFNSCNQLIYPDENQPFNGF